MSKKTPGILSPKNDYVFKRIFGDANHIAPLADFLEAALGLPATEFASLKVTDPNLNPKHDKDKHSILDVRITTLSGKDIDVEIQREPTVEICDRIQYYTSKMVTEKVKSGKSYLMAQSVSIVILDYPLWKKDMRYHHYFRLYDVEAGLSYPNSMEIHTLELPKRPADSDGTGLWDWLKFISSKTRKEFDSLAEKGNAMAEAVARLMELSADEKERLRADARDKWLWDQAARKRQHLAEGMAEGMAKGMAKGMAEGMTKGRTEGHMNAQIEIARRMLLAKKTLDEITLLTGLSKADIRRLTKKERIW